MALSLDQFINRLTDSGVMSADELQIFVDRLEIQNLDANSLIEQLVAKNKLTSYQATQLQDDTAANLVLGDYLILDSIGSGGMGEVFKAKHRLMEREVALKVLPETVSKDETSRKRFQREMVAVAKLSHPNVVTAFDARESDENFYLIMEYVEGCDLHQYVRLHGQLQCPVAVDFILQAAKGIEYAHRHGVIHRDIKPSNLLVDDTGTVRVLDLGLARIRNVNSDDTLEGVLTETGTILGTVDYMSPEQALDTRNADCRSDIYSLGATLHFLLATKPVLEGDTVGKKMQILLTPSSHNQISLQGHRNDIPAELESVFLRMISHSVEDRYQTMTNVISDLQECGFGSSDFSRGALNQIFLEESSDKILPPSHLTAVQINDQGDQEKDRQHDDTMVGHSAVEDSRVTPPAKVQSVHENKHSTYVYFKFVVVILLCVLALWAISETHIKPANDFEVSSSGRDVEVSSTVPTDQNHSKYQQRSAVIDPATVGLTIHDPSWKLIHTMKLDGLVYCSRFDQAGRLYFSMPSIRVGEKSQPGGIYRIEHDGTRTPIRNGSLWEFTLSPEEHRCFAMAGTWGKIVELDLLDNKQLREVNITNTDDGPTSFRFAPFWYSGTLVNENEFLFADFGNNKRQITSTGGIWKFGSEMNSPEQILKMTDDDERVHALDFGRENIFVVTCDRVDDKFCGRLATFDGKQLIHVPLKKSLPSIGGIVFHPLQNKLLASEFDGSRLLLISISKPATSAQWSPLITGFHRLNFATMSLSHDGRQLAIVDSGNQALYIMEYDSGS